MNSPTPMAQLCEPGATRLPLIEDDDRIAVPLAEGHGRYGFTVDHVRTGAAGLAATTPEPVDLDAVLADRTAMWEPLAAEQYVTIDITGPPAGHVWALPGALEQIIDNLLANALRVSPPSTTLTPTAPPAPGFTWWTRGPA